MKYGKLVKFGGNEEMAKALAERDRASAQEDPVKVQAAQAAFDVARIREQAKLNKINSMLQMEHAQRAAEEIQDQMIIKSLLLYPCFSFSGSGWAVYSGDGLQQDTDPPGGNWV